MANALNPADGSLGEGAAAAEIPISSWKRDRRWRRLRSDAAQRSWVAAAGFKGKAKQCLLVPSSDGRLAGVLLGTGETGAAVEPSGPPELLAGQLARALPAGAYRLEGKVNDATPLPLHGGSAPTATVATRAPKRRHPRSFAFPKAPTAPRGPQHRIRGLAGARPDIRAGVRHGAGGS